MSCAHCRRCTWSTCRQPARPGWPACWAQQLLRPSRWHCRTCSTLLGLQCPPSSSRCAQIAVRPDDVVNRVPAARRRFCTAEALEPGGGFSLAATSFIADLHESPAKACQCAGRLRVFAPRANAWQTCDGHLSTHTCSSCMISCTAESGSRMHRQLEPAPRQPCSSWQLSRVPRCARSAWASRPR